LARTASGFEAAVSRLQCSAFARLRAAIFVVRAIQHAQSIDAAESSSAVKVVTATAEPIAVAIDDIAVVGALASEDHEYGPRQPNQARSYQ
jgi:hypothetical protein